MFFLAERIPVTKVDLMFVISAHSTNTLSFMKDVMADIMKNYSTNLIHYAIVSYGDKASVLLKFSDGVTEADDLVTLVRSTSTVPGGSALDVALQKAKQLFIEDDGVRPDARKILVIITDDESSGDKEVAKSIAKDLIDNLVTVVTVAVGAGAGRRELEGLTPAVGDSLNVTIDVDPGKTGKEIIEMCYEGNKTSFDKPFYSFTNVASSLKSFARRPNKENYPCFLPNFHNCCAQNIEV